MGADTLERAGTEVGREPIRYANPTPAQRADAAAAARLLRTRLERNGVSVDDLVTEFDQLRRKQSA